MLSDQAWGLVEGRAGAQSGSLTGTTSRGNWCTGSLIQVMSYFIYIAGVPTIGATKLKSYNSGELPGKRTLWSMSRQNKSLLSNRSFSLTVLEVADLS